MNPTISKNYIGKRIGGGGLGEGIRR